MGCFSSNQKKQQEIQKDLNKQQNSKFKFSKKINYNQQEQNLGYEKYIEVQRCLIDSEKFSQNMKIYEKSMTGMIEKQIKYYQNLNKMVSSRNKQQTAKTLKINLENFEQI